MTDRAQLPHVEAELNYMAPMAIRPSYLAYDPEPGEARSNMTPYPHTVSVFDMRPIQHELDLDREGFDLVEHRTAVRDFWDDDEVRRVYYPEAEAFLREKPVPAASSSSTTCSAAGLRDCATIHATGPASRRPGSMSTTRRAPARNGSATLSPTRPKSCSRAAFR